MNMLLYGLGSGTFLAASWETIKTGLLNTVIGMLTVFAVLILISLLISSFGLISKIQNSKTKNEVAATKVETVQPTQVQEVVEEVVEDDTELVAVITAAIMASMGDEAPADGLTVRSIRKVGTTRKAFHA